MIEEETRPTGVSNKGKYDHSIISMRSSLDVPEVTLDFPPSSIQEGLTFLKKKRRAHSTSVLHNYREMRIKKHT